MGIETVAVFSDADKDAPHVRFATYAYNIGPAQSSQSYLNMEAVLEAANLSMADAIHPGYGFLSENPNFCKLVHDAGLIFIGPKPQVMELMGSKTAAKVAVKKFNVPLVPGVDRAMHYVAEAKEVAESIGYPVLLKASAGGGGKGMRIVEKAEDLAQQMEIAKSEARAAFGDDSVFLEKFVRNPKHIEVQVLADNHGNVVHLFERECSIQRRHQKLVEEAPSSSLNADQRRKIGEAAINVCKACKYTNAGTVEFLMDERGNFYFLEMNTRLQVEHPITEMITGIDIVEWQIRVAMGEELGFKQEDLRINGHAIEVRVCAEDPANNFLPDIGKLVVYRPPVGEGIRVDDGVREGMDVPIYYDPMLGKLIVHARTRRQAITMMRQAIDDFHVSGVETTLPFGRFVMDHPAFLQGEYDTEFNNKHYKPELLNRAATQEEAEIAALIAPLAVLAYSNEQSGVPFRKMVNGGTSTWGQRSK